MTDSNPTGDLQTRHTVVVPNSIDMVSLLGPGDEYLGIIEGGFQAEIHVRGNRITMRGNPGEVALAERFLDELVTIIRTGQGVTSETVERAIEMLRQETTERPADVLSMNIRRHTPKPRWCGSSTSSHTPRAWTAACLCCATSACTSPRVNVWPWSAPVALANRPCWRCWPAT